MFDVINTENLFYKSVSVSSLLPTLERNKNMLHCVTIWVLTVAISAIIALECAGMLLLSASLQNWRLSTIEVVISENGSHMLAFLVLLVYALPTTCVGAVLVVFVSPRAGGSGVPDLKAFLNGNHIPGLFSLRTWFARGLGLVLVTSAGLFAGTEGPSAHLGAITSLNIARFVYTNLQGFLPAFGHKASCEFVVQGCATGVAAAFGAPVGAILFSLEEASSFWSKGLTWRTFVGNMVAAAIAKATRVGFTALPVSGFIEFPDADVEFEFWELIPFVAIAFGTSILGVVFCATVERLTRARAFWYGSCSLWRGRVFQIAEVLVVSTITMTVCFWTPLAFGCHSLREAGQGSDTQDWYVGAQAQTLCGEGRYSDMATLLLLQKERAIKLLFTRSFEGGAEFQVVHLLLCSGIVFVLTLITYGTALPVGLFIPNILLGACFGRAVGQVVESLGYAVHPGVYALVGAVGMLAGFSRMTVSLTMMTLEITNSMRLLLPVMLCILVSKGVGDLFTDSVYDIGVALHPLGPISILRGDLDEEDMPLLRFLTVHDACSVRVHTLKCQECAANIIATLVQTHFSGFPLVNRPEHRVRGLVLREKLLEALHDAGVLDASSALSGETLPEPEGVVVDLLPYADQAPEVQHWNTPLAKAYRHFMVAGLRHLCVVDETHRLVGVVTRSDLTMMSHPGSRQHSIRALLHRKTAELNAQKEDQEHLPMERETSFGMQISEASSIAPTRSGGEGQMWCVY